MTQLFKLNTPDPSACTNQVPVEDPLRPVREAALCGPREGGPQRSAGAGEGKSIYSMFLVKWVPIFSKQTWILGKSSYFIDSPFSLEHKIPRKKRSDRYFRRFCGEVCTLSANHFHFTECPFYREQLAADFVQQFPFYRIPIFSRTQNFVKEAK